MMKQQLDFDNIELSFYERLVLKTIPIFKSAFFYNKRTIDDLLTKDFAFHLKLFGFIEPPPLTLLWSKTVFLLLKIN